MKKELLIFGANGALGKGITEVLTEKDFDKVYLFDFDLTGLPDWKNIDKIIIKDLADEKNVIDSFSKVTPSKEKYYFLYSTVGGFAGGNNIWETEVEELNKMINMNFKSSFFIAKHFARLVKESSGGSICFTAAFTGVNPETKKAAYGSAKAALIHLVKTLSLEGKEINLTVNAIAPYIIDTPANRDWMPAPTLSGKDADYEKWMKPQEIGELVNSIFNHFNFLTGNIINLTHRFKI
ncbi:MAG: SDR family NAD(P)-dependent oxidoreductase [Ignavibacteria bacterium]|nr:SDR family NAD(P)-dependent oxidoreductase [Ignavibacteria bacterium]